MADNKVYDVEYRFKVRAVDKEAAEREAELMLGGGANLFGDIEVSFSAANYYDHGQDEI